MPTKQVDRGRREAAVAKERPHPILARIRARFQASMYPELRSVRCVYANGVLTLSGVVPTFYLKQVAFSLTDNVEGIDRVDNRVDVMAYPERNGTTRG